MAFARAAARGAVRTWRYSLGTLVAATLLLAVAVKGEGDASTISDAAAAAAAGDAGSAAGEDTAAVATAAAPAFPSEADTAFMQWVMKSGGKFTRGVYSFMEGAASPNPNDGDSHSTDGSSRGLFAKADVANGDDVFSIPSTAALIAPSARSGYGLPDIALATSQDAIKLKKTRVHNSCRLMWGAPLACPYLAALATSQSTLRSEGSQYVPMMRRAPLACS
jgi:hypothetical protein